MIPLAYIAYLSSHGMTGNGVRGNTISYQENIFPVLFYTVSFKVKIMKWKHSTSITFSIVGFRMKPLS